MVNILNIKCVNEEEENDLSIQMGMVADLIATQFQNITIPEIQESLKMYVAKKFEIKVFRLLDCISIGEILNAYIENRDELTKVYVQKRNIIKSTPKYPSKDEKEAILIDGVNRVFVEFISTGDIDGPTEYLFDFLLEKGKIKQNNTPALNKYYQSKMDEAKVQLKHEMIGSQEAIKSPFQRKQFKNELEKISSGDSNKLIIRAKRNILLEYFKKQNELQNETIF